MTGLSGTATFHFHTNGKVILGYRGIGVPRVGDEVRLEEHRFYRVIRVVWIYDEPEAIGQRVNVELESLP